jgi:hypothetical protein
MFRRLAPVKLQAKSSAVAHPTFALLARPKRRWRSAEALQAEKLSETTRSPNLLPLSHRNARQNLVNNQKNCPKPKFDCR